MSATDESAGNPVEPRGLISSVRRALRVLEVAAEVGDGVTAKAIARRTGLKLSTTYQLINTLVHEGYLVRLNNAHGFGIGYKVFNLQRDTDLTALPSVSRVLRELQAEARTPLYFTVFRDATLTIAEVVDSPDAPRAKEFDVGFTEAPHATAYGKLMLAELDPTAREEYLAGSGLRRITERTVTSRRELEEQLDQVREVGFALEIEELQPGLTCMAAPVRDAAGAVRGAVATSGGCRAVATRRWELERAVRHAAARVSRVVAAGERDALGTTQPS